jgi:hypothetical protein
MRVQRTRQQGSPKPRGSLGFDQLALGFGNGARGNPKLFGEKPVGFAGIESLGNGHLTTLVTGNTARMETVSTILRQKDKDTRKCQDKLDEVMWARTEVKYLGILST